MKKKFKMENLDCANCAAKMEERIGQIPGVKEVSVSFLMQKLTIDASESEFAEIMNKAQQICRKVEPDCRILYND